jgi:cell wall-associated NlpC family hydrolase
MRLNLLYLVMFSISLTGCGGMTLHAPVSQPPVVASVPPPPPAATRKALPTHTPQQTEALLQTLLALGIDYQWGGQSPTTGFDCSGLVAHVFLKAYGLKLPRITYGQAKAGMAVQAEELEAGDLVFFNTLNRPFSHVGIYLGDGRFVHAPKTGAQVRVEKFDNPYWNRRYDGARRIQI